MKKFSRILVALFGLLIWQSSLGTKAIQVVSQNLWSESAQNGYTKLSNNLLIQWGYSKVSGSNRYIYFPQTFADKNYFVAGSIYTSDANAVAYSINIIATSVSYFKSNIVYHFEDGDKGFSNQPFLWFAIGRGIN